MSKHWICVLLLISIYYANDLTDKNLDTEVH